MNINIKNIIYVKHSEAHTQQSHLVRQDKNIYSELDRTVLSSHYMV